MKVGFTGTQNGMTEFQKIELAKLFNLLKVSEFVHGDCIGSDEEANEIAFNCGIRVFSIFPSTYYKKRAFCFNESKILNNDDGKWNTISYKNENVQVRWYPKDMPLNRNHHIVDNVARMIATPKEHEHTLRSGTWATIRYAWKTKRDITIIPPIIRGEEDK